MMLLFFWRGDGQARGANMRDQIFRVWAGGRVQGDSDWSSLNKYAQPPFPRDKVCELLKSCIGTYKLTVNSVSS